MSPKKRPWDKQGPVQAARDIGGCAVTVIAGLGALVTGVVAAVARIRGIA